MSIPSSDISKGGGACFGVAGFPRGAAPVFCHASNVDCLVFLGEVVKDSARIIGSFLDTLALGFFVGSWNGDGKAGESTRSSVSITSAADGGVLGRCESAARFEGRVCARCIGPRLLLVKVDGNSSRGGERDFSFDWGRTSWGNRGEEDMRSTYVCFGGDTGFDSSEGSLHAFARALDSFAPGFVTLANRSMVACDALPTGLVALVERVLGAALFASFVEAVRFVFCGFCCPASQSCTLSGTPTLTYVSRTQTRAGL